MRSPCRPLASGGGEQALEAAVMSGVAGSVLPVAPAHVAPRLGEELDRVRVIGASRYSK